MQWWQIAVLTVLLLSALVQPSSIPAKSLPCISVALVGAASWLAHIGVLEWFEVHRTPTDCVAGTRMGDLIGRAYVTRMHLPEIREWVSQIDWDEGLRG